MALKTNKNYFWSNSFVDPKRKSRFFVEFGGQFDELTKGKYPWTVKSINRPKFQVGYDTDSYANQFTGDIGVALPTSWTWQEITVKFVNPYSNTLAPEVGQDLDDILTRYTSARIAYGRSPSVDGDISSNKGFFEDQVADPVSERYLGSRIKIYDLSMGYETKEVNQKYNNFLIKSKKDYNLDRLEIRNGNMYANGYWVLQHPWITKVDFGDHDYSSDDLLEISLSFRYKRANYYPIYNNTLLDDPEEPKLPEELPEALQQALGNVDRSPFNRDDWTDTRAAERSRQIEEERRRAATVKPKPKPKPKPSNELVATPPPAPSPNPVEPPPAKASGPARIPQCILTREEQRQVTSGERTKDEICKAKAK